MHKIQVFAVAAVLSLVGCASSGLSKEERRAENDRIMAKWEAEEKSREGESLSTAAIRARFYKVGAPEASFRAAFGEPAVILAQSDAGTVTRYYIQEQPKVIVFARGIVYSIREDYEERERQVASQSVKMQEERNQELERSNRIMQMNAIQSAMPRTTYTTCRKDNYGATNCETR